MRCHLVLGSWEQFTERSIHSIMIDSRVKGFFALLVSFLRRVVMFAVVVVVVVVARRLVRSFG